MPSHYTARELAQLQERRKAKAAQAVQLSLFKDEPPSIAHPMTERIIEIDGHRWRCRSWGTHEEHIPID